MTDDYAHIRERLVMNRHAGIYKCHIFCKIFDTFFDESRLNPIIIVSEMQILPGCLLSTINPTGNRAAILLSSNIADPFSIFLHNGSDIIATAMVDKYDFARKCLSQRTIDCP